MKNKIKIFVVLLIIILVIIYVNNEREKYIIGNTDLYDKAINYLIENNDSKYINKDNYKLFITYKPFGITKDKTNYYAYMWILKESYYTENNIKEEGEGSSVFYKFTFKDNKVIKYDNPKDGSFYNKSLEKLCFNRSMYYKVSNYKGELNLDKEIDEYFYYLDTNNIQLNDLINEDNLYFTIKYYEKDLLVYKDKLILKENDNIIYETEYEYDILNIIKNSINITNLKTNIKYEIISGNNKFRFNTDDNNIYLKEFLQLIEN